MCRQGINLLLTPPAALFFPFVTGVLCLYCPVFIKGDGILFIAAMPRVIYRAPGMVHIFHAGMVVAGDVSFAGEYNINHFRKELVIHVPCAREG